MTAALPLPRARLPVLATPRLRLLPLDRSVAAALLAGHPTDLVAAPGWPHPDTRDALRLFVEHAPPDSDGGWLVARRDAGDIIGDCGWKGGPDADGVAELGYGLARPFHGRGLGTEAVAAMAGWCLTQPDVRLLVAMVRPENVPSRRLLARLGFALVAAEGPELRYELPGRPAGP